jgi:hypothetical protein
MPLDRRPGRVANTRELVIRRTPYIVPYRVKGEVVQIITILHSAQRWPDRLPQEDISRRREGPSSKEKASIPWASQEPKKKGQSVRHAITFIGIALMISNTAVGGDFTNARIHPRRNIGVEAVSMNNGENPFQYCRRVGTDDNPGDVPVSLAPAFAKVFGVRMTPAEIQRNSSFRCYRGKVMGCMVGANLNCGKAETSKTSQGGDEWCRSHPDDVMIPMAATGHATIFSWRCSGDRAVPAKVISKVDDQRFEVINWKPLN